MQRTRGLIAGLGVLSALVALPATAVAEPTATPDTFRFAPIVRKVIPVLRNDAGDGLRIVAHSGAGHGKVDCDATTCTYTPPPRAFPDDNADDFGLVTPDQDDTFSYTVADSSDQQSSADVRLVAFKPRASTHKEKATSRSRCTRSTHARKPNPKRRPSDTPGQGGAISFALAVCRTTKTTPFNQGPGDTPGANVPAAPLRAALRASQFTGSWSARCSFTGGQFGFGGFNIHEWIGENGSTGVDRMTIRFRQQVYGENGFGGHGWSTLLAVGWASNSSVPDSWNTWFPANRDHRWVYAWAGGDETLVEGYEAFRMQVRVQWIHRRKVGPDKRVIDPGWYTRCQGQPHVPTS